MSAFRKSALAFAVAALMSTSVFAQLPGLGGEPADPAALSTPVVPDNQNINCSVIANPLTVRAEGFAEILGDLVMECNGFLRFNPRNRVNYAPGLPPAPQLIPQINISVTLSVPLTNREVVSGITDALLFIDDPTNPVPPLVGDPQNALRQNPCTGANATCSGFVQVDGIFPGLPGDGLATQVTNDTVGGAPNPEGGRVMNVFQGVKQNNQTVVFVGIPLSDFDGRTNPRLLSEYRNIVQNQPGGVYRGQEIRVPFRKIFRIKGMRGAIPGAAAANGQIFAFVSIQNPPTRLLLNQASAVVGFVQNGLTFRQRNLADDGTNPTIALVTCTAQNRDLASDATDADPLNPHFIAQYIEGYRVAFRVRGFGDGPLQNDPRANYNTESSFYNTNFPATNGLSIAGIADAGTRLRLVVNNIPANVRIYTSVAGVAGTSATVGAYGVVADLNGANPAPISVRIFPSVSVNNSTTVTNLIGAGGVATAVHGAPIPAIGFAAGGVQGLYWLQFTPTTRQVMTWEVYAADPLQNEQVNFLVFAAFRPALNPGIGTATIQGTLAPINTTATTAGLTVPVPRFAETGGPSTGFSLAPCLTNLLFPFVSNQNGFNTGLAVSNTSLSNPGTGELFSLDANNGISPQSGTCSLNYFGTTGTDGAAPPPDNTASIPAGRTFTMTLASGQPSANSFGPVRSAQNFQGYMIVQCNFRYAHGYAFISDMGATQLAHGYVALVMDTNFTIVNRRTGINGEALGQ